MTMRSLAFLLIAGFALVLMAGEVDAKEPEWSYTADYSTRSVAISADGDYIVAGSSDNRVYFFDKGNGTPLWTYEAGDAVVTVAISADGE